LSYNGSGVVAANIVEGAKNAVVAAHDNYGLAGNSSSDELSRRLNLIGACD
jgi:type III secretion system FlhB-like substrate exporter